MKTLLSGRDIFCGPRSQAGKISGLRAMLEIQRTKSDSLAQANQALRETLASMERKAKTALCLIKDGALAKLDVADQNKKLKAELAGVGVAMTKLATYNTNLYRDNLSLREQMAHNESWSKKAGDKLASYANTNELLLKQNDELRDKVKMIKASRKMIAMDEKSFDTLLTELINRFSKESGSNTPDFILAKYLTETLAAFDKATTTREGWFISPPWGCKPEKGVVTFTIS